MTMKKGDLIPDAQFVVMEDGNPVAKTTDDLFGGQNVALFGLPGAYTPVCHKEHLPGIVQLHDVLRQNGIDLIACTAVNDVFVLNRWADELGANDKVLMLADGNAEFAIKSGLAFDMRRYGLGVRSSRYAMLVADKKVTLLSIEGEVMEHKVSSAQHLNKQVETYNAQNAVG